MSALQKEPSRVLIIDDQASVRKFLKTYLREHGFEVLEAWSLSVAHYMFNLWKPRIVVLDLILENEDGLDFLRSGASDAKTIVVSAKGNVSDRIFALEAGADDYLTKPVEPRELLLKIQKLQRYNLGGHVATQGEDRFCDVTVDMLTRLLSGPSTKAVKLSQSELTLLRMLLRQVNITLEKNEIARLALGHNLREGSRAVDVMVSKLRTKLRIVGSKVSIRSARDHGYVSLFDPKEAHRDLRSDKT